MPQGNPQLQRKCIEENAALVTDLKNEIDALRSLMREMEKWDCYKRQLAQQAEQIASLELALKSFQEHHEAQTKDLNETITQLKKQSNPCQSPGGDKYRYGEE